MRKADRLLVSRGLVLLVLRLQASYEKISRGDRMLVEFTIGNFRSFQNPVTLNLFATKLKAHDREVDVGNVAEVGNLRLLHVAALYGANASGKSNLVKGMNVLRNLVLHSARESLEGDLPARPFRLAEKGEQACHLEAVFLSGRNQYRYGVEFTTSHIVREWLFHRAEGRKTEKRLFERNGTSFIHERFKEGHGIVDKTREDALHLSVCAQFAGPVSMEIVQWFRRLNIVPGHGDEDDMLRSVTTKLFGSYERAASAIRTLVQRLDVGIADLGLISIDESELSLPNGLPEEVRQELLDRLSTSFVTTHHVRTNDGKELVIKFSLDGDESDGTRKLVSLAGPLIDTLVGGSILVIDEMDARLHPLISRELVKLFQDPETNPHHAQLVFTTHDTNLLTRTLLRRDQVWFVEKHPEQQWSDLYSLAELREENGELVRNDASFEQDYLHGRYGAVPFVGSLRALLGLELKNIGAESIR
jgi:AAA15 family ATPase/GTPase